MESDATIYRPSVSSETAMWRRVLASAIVLLVVWNLLYLGAVSQGRAAPVVPATCSSNGYAVTFTESGLPNGSSWNVLLGASESLSSTNSHVAFSEANGSYSFLVGPSGLYLPSPVSGSVLVSGGSVGVFITFTHAPPSYPVTFAETGLPAGAAWSVALQNSNIGTLSTYARASSLSLSVPNGTYSFAIGPDSWGSPSPASGNVTVNGTSVTGPAITFSPYGVSSVSFRATGVPTGSPWWISVGTPEVLIAELSTTTVTLLLPSGALPFHVVSSAGFGLARVIGPGTPSQTQINVSGPSTYTLRFGLNETLYFNESAVPGYQLYPGASWSVSLHPVPGRGGPSAQSASTTGTSLQFSVPKGAVYSFQATGPGSEYKVLPAAGTLQVPAHSLAKVVKFKLLTETVLFTERGLTVSNSWTVTIVSGDSPVFAYPFSVSKMAGAGAITFKLPVGNFSYSISVSSAQTPSPASGTVMVAAAPSPAQAILVTVNS